ncbi:NaeI family type II restriction endonuclease [Amycolatopsis sp. cmx-4-83]|uniref:NaeI family type II restriction endonuclease n=1 Tax=Amycolatopsis sp. cmx-4-83 TaxID=2790940 RepID=UPI00397A55DD
MSHDELDPQQTLLPGIEPADDPALNAVAESILRDDPDGSRFAGAIRRSIDMLLDGQHTGRYRWDQLFKTEKAHAGTLIEINLQREFKFTDGKRMDYEIAGFEVDCKFSQTRFAWMIPPEAHNEIILGVWASDTDSIWCAGLVRARSEYLNTGGNRDAKRTLNAVGRSAVKRLFWEAPLQENLLLKLPRADIDAIFAPRSGQKRVNELFLRAQKRRVSRNVVATVAMQDDYMKRVRSNGGARSNLQPRGIVILGDYTSHGALARQLGLPVPGPGEFVSARLVRLNPDRPVVPYVSLEGERWTLAREEDAEELVPKLPTI